MLVILLVANILIIQIKDLTFLFLIFLIVFIISLISKNRLVIKIFPSLFGIGIFIIFFHLIFNTTVNLSDRFDLGIKTMLKIFSLSLFTFIFVSNNSISTIIEIFSFLPKRFQLMLTITFSIIPVIISETQKIVIIQKCRGYNTRSLNIYKSIIPVIIPLLHRSLKRTEQIAVILQTRGFKDE